MRRNLVLLSAILAVAAFGVSCSGSPAASSGKLIVATSIAPLADFVKNVGGDRVQVESLVPPAASPHTYEPTPSQLRLLSSANMLILNDIGLEFWADKVISAVQNPNLRVVNISEGLSILAGGADEGPAGNPHVWLNPLNAIKQVEHIRDALSQADAAGASVYAANADAYIAQLTQMHEDFLQRAQAFAGHDIITFHAAWDYFAQAYGLTVAAVIETTPGKEPSPAEIAQIVDTAKSIKAKAIFAEAQFSPKAAETIAAESGTEVLIVNPMGYAPDYSYIGMMQQNFNEIEQALK
jgi:zinc transport system substrate-binding protein